MISNDKALEWVLHGSLENQQRHCEPQKNVHNAAYPNKNKTVTIKISTLTSIKIKKMN